MLQNMQNTILNILRESLLNSFKGEAENVVSIYVTGSLGRQEAAFIKNSLGNLELYNDVDILVVVHRQPPGCQHHYIARGGCASPIKCIENFEIGGFYKTLNGRSVGRYCSSAVTRA